HGGHPPQRRKIEATLTVIGEPNAGTSRTNGAATVRNTQHNVHPAQIDDDQAVGSLNHRAALNEVLSRIKTQVVESNTGLGSFLLTAAFWGLITLFTPCVFPMIPITVSFFLKQAEKKE